jgi:hypothetical protein
MLTGCGLAAHTGWLNREYENKRGESKRNNGHEKPAGFQKPINEIYADPYYHAYEY